MSQVETLAHTDLVKETQKALATGRFFRVKFIKRGDGSIRSMTIRGGVRKGVKPSTPEERQKRATTDENQRLLRGFMVGESNPGFRSFGFDRLISVTTDGKTLVSEDRDRILNGGCADV